tara:strand:- start:542 stop:1006 length:465 start_codon:yes stop_codon:yes gene_type:complete
MDEKYIKNLNNKEVEVIVNKGTEKPYTGLYNDFFNSGIYICKACSQGLYFSSCKFDSGCGWPSFDDEIEDSIKRVPDYSLGRVRTEILCSNCNGHLGHVFEGEKYTKKNIRHCVNSISIKFVPLKKEDIKNIDYISEKYRVPKKDFLLFFNQID